jgi:hypothetical protein
VVYAYSLVIDYFNYGAGPACVRTRSEDHNAAHLNKTPLRCEYLIFGSAQWIRHHLGFYPSVAFTSTEPMMSVLSCVRGMSVSSSSSLNDSRAGLGAKRQNLKVGSGSLPRREVGIGHSARSAVAFAGPPLAIQVATSNAR